MPNLSHPLRLLCATALTGIIVAALLLVSRAGAPAPAASTRPLSTGVITNIGSRYFTVRTAGARGGMLNRMVSAATKITRENLPYVWGGGHAHAGVADVGVPGHGNSQTRDGYDCSGAVGALLAEVGLYPAGESVPNDAGIISYLLDRHLIAPGEGRGPASVTFYDDPGVHIFMAIEGRFWGASSGGPAGDGKGGPGWLDGAGDANSKTFKRYHLRDSVLRVRRGAGYTITFAYGPAGSGRLTGLKLGEPVNVSYAEAADGTLLATSIAHGRIYVRHGVSYIRQQALVRTRSHYARLSSVA